MTNRRGDSSLSLRMTPLFCHPFFVTFFLLVTHFLPVPFLLITPFLNCHRFLLVTLFFYFSPFLFTCHPFFTCHPEAKPKGLLPFCHSERVQYPEESLKKEEILPLRLRMTKEGSG